MTAEQLNFFDLLKKLPAEPAYKPLVLYLFPSEIKRLGGIEKVKKDNPGVIIKVKRMKQ